MASSKKVSRPAWWPTKEQKERADKACAEAQSEKETIRRAELSRLSLGLVSPDEFSNDELLALGIGYGIAGPLSDEQVQQEASERLAEITR